MTGTRLEGRTSIVTGASRGLGRAIAVALASEGAAVAVVSRTEQVWDERLPGTIGDTVAQIQEAGGHALAVRADVSQPEDRHRLVEEARQLGPVSILVNNAAFTAPGRPPAPGATTPAKRSSPSGAEKEATKADWPTFLHTPLAAYQRHFQVGPFAAYELMQLVVPDMVEAGAGAIVNISSGASRAPGEAPWGERSGGLLPGYGGAKAALEHLTLCAAYELADRGIAVNALSPSKAIPTPGLAYYSPVFTDVGSDQDFAEAVVRLAGAGADQVTGRILGHLDVLDGSFRSYQFHQER
ncbi:MAG TPA: SDR family NAD(P)-dependent oxidoreductase [Acidimicrobiales bacterium]|nr:SDR family NAD(P)-dependent oxidoreductase [Acidimicrobiales bacterium]